MRSSSERGLIFLRVAGTVYSMKISGTNIAANLCRSNFFISKTDPEKILSRYVSNRKIILITDACHAGGIGMSSQLMAFSTRSIQQRTFRLLNKLATSHDGLGILSASRANELSQEDSKWEGATGYLPIT